MWKHKIKNTVWERGKRKKSQAEGSLHFAVKGAWSESPGASADTKRTWPSKTGTRFGLQLGPMYVSTPCRLLLGYFELLKYFQRPGLSFEGATITELDTNEVTTMEGNTIAVLPHRYSVIQGVLVSSKPSGWAKTNKKYLFSIKIGYVDGALLENPAPRARPYLRNCRNPPIREILVLTWLYARKTVSPHHRKTNEE